MKIFEEIEFWQYKVILKNFKEDICGGVNGKKES